MKKTVLDYLKYVGSAYADKPAFVDEKGCITFGELVELTDCIGAGLIRNGASDRQPMIVFLEKSTMAVATLWGITKSGNIYVPFDVDAPAERLNKIMKVLTPAFVIAEESTKEKAALLEIEPEKILMVEQLAKTKCTEEEKECLLRIEKHLIDTDPLYIICTSGSTGVPKGVVISHRAVMDFTDEASEVMNFTEKEVFLSQAPFYFDLSVLDLYCTLRNGATLHLIPKEMYRFPIDVLTYIHDHQVNAIIWVPSALILTANLRALGEVDITCLKKVMFCGEVMPVKQLNMWRKHLPNATYVNYYGPSETTCASTYYIVNREFRNDESLPIGNAALNTGVLILNEQDQPVKKGELGELCIMGSGLSNGYYNNPEKTKEVFVQNPLNTAFPERMYRTGDLVRVNEHDEIEYVCRKDFQIKHMGYRIELGEIETAAASLDTIKRVCCLYDEKKQQIVMFYEGSETPESLLAVLTEKLPDYMLPRKILKENALPLNENGKIDRVLLKTRL